MKSRDLHLILIAVSAGLLILSLITSIYLAGSLAEEERERYENDRYYDGLREVFESERFRDDPLPVQSEMKNDNTISVFDITSCWIEIPGTGIDYPVMQEGGTKGYYLDHRPDGSRASSGCLFIPAGDSIDSDNIIIYGHHMKNGTMLAGLERYRDGNWASDHRIIRLYTRLGIRSFKVIGVVVQSMHNRYFMWDDHISFPDTGSSFEYGYLANRLSVTRLDNSLLSETEMNRYLTLVTCDYNVSDGRLIVVACEV